MARVIGNNSGTERRARRVQAWKGGSASLGLLLLVVLLASIGQWIEQNVGGFEVQQNALGPFDASVYRDAVAVPLAIVPLLGGLLADRFRRALVLRLSLAVQGIALAAFAVLALFRALTPIDSIVVGVVFVCGLAVAEPTRRALVANLVAPANLLRAVALTAIAVNLGELLAPLIQFVVVQVANVRAAADLAPYLLITGMILFMVAAVVVSAIDRRSTEPLATDVTSPASLGESLDYLDERPDLLLLLGVVGFVAVLGQAFSQLGSNYAQNALRMAASGVTELRLPILLGTIAAAVVLALVGVPRRARRPLLVASQVGLIVSVAGLYASPSLMAVNLVLGLSGFAATAFGILSGTVILSETRPGMQGRMMGAYALLVGGLAPVGALLATRLNLLFGGSGALVVIDVLYLAVLIVAVTRPAWRRDLTYLEEQEQA